MRIGFNFTSAEGLPIAKRLLADNLIDYCEILIDNFLHLDPKDIRNHFDCPIAFHIMRSCFLESSDKYLSDIAERIKYHARELNPIYVSDHLAEFSINGRLLHFISEIDYRKRMVIFNKIARWQEMLECQLFLENYPSLLDGGHEAPHFFSEMRHKTGAGLLFDISNAVCAAHNCEYSSDLWIEEARSTSHYHIAGYGPAISDDNLFLDTHAEEISSLTMQFFLENRDIFTRDNATVTYERDRNLDYESIARDIVKIKSACDLNAEGSPQ
ncbi:methanobactin biosynthesis protein MbnB [Acetobacter tropicalis]|uniref:methanobactin biosynthesis protein MbnB n=1 Tax=Acetobacter tropicalis TaxID=104102 RepID=UPI003976DF49